MAHGVSTEWFDLNVKYGNYLPMQKQATLAEVQLAAQEKHEQENKLQNKLDRKDMEQIKDMQDDLDFDDEFMKQYMSKRKAELVYRAEKYRYGHLIEISRDQYVREVTNADPQSFVILHLYQDSNQFCRLINQHLLEHAKTYGSIKFIKMVATKCIDKFPDQNCPCIIIYKGGKPVSHVTNVDKIMRGDIKNFLAFLISQGIPLVA